MNRYDKIYIRLDRALRWTDGLTRTPSSRPQRDGEVRESILETVMPVLMQEIKKTKMNKFTRDELLALRFAARVDLETALDPGSEATIGELADLSSALSKIDRMLDNV